MTDLEQCGYRAGSMEVPRRHLVLSVDCEAFLPEQIEGWSRAMHYWRECSRRHRLPCCFFVAIEDVVRLRARDGRAYGNFVAAVRGLDRDGSRFYPHNHGAFDPKTGVILSPPASPDSPSLRYSKRPSLYYNVVYGNRLDIGSWLGTVRATYEHFLRETGCTRPRHLAFRAGGWDYGTTCEDLGRYLKGLMLAGFSIDSSACSGVFGTPSWRMGARFGANAFRCTGGLVEVAPCWAVDCGVGPGSPSYWRALPQLCAHRGLWTGASGIFMVVLHFDHLFRRRPQEAVTDFRSVASRIEGVFRLLAAIRTLLGLGPATFDDLPLGIPDGV